jgi:hypothetical protein
LKSIGLKKLGSICLCDTPGFEDTNGHWIFRKILWWLCIWFHCSCSSSLGGSS